MLPGIRNHPDADIFLAEAAETWFHSWIRTWIDAEQWYGVNEKKGGPSMAIPAEMGSGIAMACTEYSAI
ncbi:MAG TPA: hypothetical protein DEO88_07555 [Syntrophobacteraceae bacterium]|nr:hypothetical protein [Syntrophobacteraceae bacterium]